MVDNASVDGTQASISSAFPEVIFIANAKNVGFSAANNQAFAISKGQYILLLNPDAKLTEEHLNLALIYLREHPATIIGPELLYPDLSKQQSVLQYPTFIYVFKEAFFMNYIFNSSVKNLLIDNNYALSGACLLMTKVVYDSLRGLDEDLFWMDDVDLCYRAKGAGVKIKYFTEWTVIHVIGQSSKKNYNLSISNQLLSKLKFFKKNNQFINYYLSVFFTQIHIALRIILFFVLFPFSSIFRAKFRAYSYSQYLFLKYIFTSKKQTF